MAQGIRLTWVEVDGDPMQAFVSAGENQSVANTKAMDRLSSVIKPAARAEIASGGFGVRWRNALRVDRFPKSRRVFSLNAALWIWHKIPYAGVFEQGATITGKPMLWIPLSTMPKKIGGKRATPANYKASVGPLIQVNRPGKNPLLIGKPPAGMRKGRTKASKALHSRFANSAAAPLFVGVSSVKIKKRYSLQRLFERLAGNLVGYVEEAQKEDD